MINKKRRPILIVVIIICIILLAIIVFNHFNLNKKDQCDENLATVSFSLENKSLIEITCEIASTPQERSKGLMNRTYLPEDEGMLFVYEKPQILSFWMKNTLIPLDIIFIDESGIVINIESADVELDKDDEELTRYVSMRPAAYVVEINQGLSNRYGIIQGTKTFIEYL